MTLACYGALEIFGVIFIIIKANETNAVYTVTQESR